MEQLKQIIEEGTDLNNQTITPTLNEKLNIKMDILRSISDKDIFVMNKKLFDTPTKIDISSTEWLKEPLLIFCPNPEETAKNICLILFEKGYQHVRARNDIYPSRTIVDVEFEVNAILAPINKTLSKHSDTSELYGAHINTNSALILPILLYEYITPKFNWENWKNNLELEPKLWNKMQSKWLKGVSPIKFNTVDKIISQKMFNLIKSEDEGAYLFTGDFTYYSMTHTTNEYRGDYHIYHRDPIEFLKKIHSELPDLKIREEQPIYYFQKPYYHLIYESEPVLTLYTLDYPMNFVRLGFYNHTNYHGLLMFLVINALKSPLKDYDELISNIGFLVKYRNSHPEGHTFNILQNNIIGPRTSPQVELMMKSWNKELKFFYRPDKEMNASKNTETEST